MLQRVAGWGTLRKKRGTMHRSSLRSQTHRITEQPGMEETSRGRKVQPVVGKGSLDRRHPVRSHLESLQRWGLQHTPGEAVPVIDHSHCHFFFSLGGMHG